jgi:S-formylglutathione hydrolase FrmB
MSGAPMRALAAVLLAVSAATAHAQVVPPPAAPPAAAPSAAPQGTVRTDSLRSQSLGTTKRYRVYLPPSYAADSARRYPVVYYLHGHGGDETNWTELGRLHLTMDSLVARGVPEMIVVMPDGDDGWYTTWNALPDLAGCRAATRTEPADRYCVAWPHYDDYLARDLVAHVDSTYRTLATRAHRAIAGLSMGGYGAVALALAYPDVFSAAASHSGTLSPLHRPAADSLAAPDSAYAASVEELEGIWSRGIWPTIRPAFGPDTAGWWARDPGRLAGRARDAGRAALPRLYLDVGRDDPYAHQTRDFHRTLVRLGVPHEYAERPGTHDWAYWRRWVATSLWWLGAQL